MPELKTPCPACKQMPIAHRPNAKNWGIMCDNDDCPADVSIEAVFESEEEAIAAWESVFGPKPLSDNMKRVLVGVAIDEDGFWEATGSSQDGGIGSKNRAAEALGIGSHRQWATRLIIAYVPRPSTTQKIEGDIEK